MYGEEHNSIKNNNINKHQVLEPKQTFNSSNKKQL